MATLDLKIFEGCDRQELSMIEVAHALLEQRGEIIDFSDLVNELQNYLGKSDLEIREKLSQFYTDLNIDGSFISLGDNRWGLRSWYAIDEIDEALINVEEADDEEEDSARRKKRKKRVNAFVNEDDNDAIDWNNDDAEDDDLDDNDDDDLDVEDNEDDEEEEIAAYDSDLSEVEVAEDEEAEKIDPSLIGADEEDLAVDADSDLDDEDDDSDQE